MSTHIRMTDEAVSGAIQKKNVPKESLSIEPDQLDEQIVHQMNTFLANLSPDSFAFRYLLYAMLQQKLKYVPDEPYSIAHPNDENDCAGIVMSLKSWSRMRRQGICSPSAPETADNEKLLWASGVYDEIKDIISAESP